MSLAAGVDEIIEVFRHEEGMLNTLEALFPDAPTQRHRFARHTIERVKMVLQHDPHRRGAVIARLEMEYKQIDASPESPMPHPKN